MDIGRVMIPVTDAHVHVATTFVKETVTKIFFPRSTAGQLSSKSDLSQSSFSIFNRLSWDFAR